MYPVPSHVSYTCQDIPGHISRPDYVLNNGLVNKEALPSKPVIWSEEDISKIRKSCRIAREVLNSLEAKIVPGITTDELGKLLMKSFNPISDGIKN